MTDRLTPTDLHERLDTLGWLSDAQTAGVYALELSVGPYPTTTWDDHFDVAPDDGLMDALRFGHTLVYVGESHDMYARLMDHCTQARRKATLLKAYPPADIHGLWPFPDASDTKRRAAEGNIAGQIGNKEGVVCWCNGDIY